MREKTVRRLITIVEESHIESLEYKNWWTSIRITKKLANGSNGSGSPSNLTVYPAVSHPPASAAPAPAPDAKPYVEIGDVVEPGQVVCIIEAMKLMNEIESEVKGKIVKVPAENGNPVEFGQTLFLM